MWSELPLGKLLSGEQEWCFSNHYPQNKQTCDDEISSYRMSWLRISVILGESDDRNEFSSNMVLYIKMYKRNFIAILILDEYFRKLDKTIFLVFVISALREHGRNFWSRNPFSDYVSWCKHSFFAGGEELISMKLKFLTDCVSAWKTVWLLIKSMI